MMLQSILVLHDVLGVDVSLEYYVLLIKAQTNIELIRLSRRSVLLRKLRLGS